MPFGNVNFFNLCGSELKVSINHTDQFLVLRPMGAKDGELILARGVVPRGQEARCGVVGSRGGSSLVQNHLHVWFGNYMLDGWRATVAISTDEAPLELDLQVYLFHSAALLSVHGRARTIQGEFPG